MSTYTINKKTISLPLPRLFSTDKLGRTKFWEVCVNNDEYHYLSGIVDGKVKTYNPVKVVGKNKGKKNETSDHEQAVFEAYSKWEKKHDQGYTEEHSTEEENKLPMLAQKYSERKKYLVEPFGISAKLDGVRCMAFYKNSEVILKSRLGKEFKWMNLIRDQLKILFEKWGKNIIFDGELYSHTLPFNAISGAARSGVKSKYDDKMEFWIFDLAILDMPYREREKLMKQMNDDTKSDKIYFVFSEQSTHDDVEPLHEKYVSQGYEGIILRNYDGLYKFNFRVNDLQKYKHFVDEEFLVIDTDIGKGTEEGAIIFICQSGVQVFSVRPRGSIAKRRFMEENRQLYIGKKLTVRYQPNNDDCLPRFPTGISFPEDVSKLELDKLIAVDLRDYE